MDARDARAARGGLGFGKRCRSVRRGTPELERLSYLADQLEEQKKKEPCEIEDSRRCSITIVFCRVFGQPLDCVRRRLQDFRRAHGNVPESGVES